MESRKHNRLENFDYSTTGYYFITVCTAKKQKILCDIVGCGILDAPFSLNFIVAEAERRGHRQRDVASISGFQLLPSWETGMPGKRFCIIIFSLLCIIYYLLL